MKRIFIFILFMLPWLVSYGQKGYNLRNNKSHIDLFPDDTIVDKIDSLKEQRPSIEISTDYANKVNFWGRNFGLNQYGFEASAFFKSGKGLFLYGTQHYWSAVPNKLAKTDIGIGYEKYLTNNFIASFSYEQWFYHNGDNFVRNALTHFAEAACSYEFNYFNIDPSFYFMFGTEKIFQANIAVNQEFYLFRFMKHTRVYFTPDFLTSFANQNFLPIYSDYPVNYHNYNKFKLVDFELSMPISISYKNLEIEPCFRYNIPVKAMNENISSFYYFTMHLSWNIFYDKHHTIKNIYKIE
jgi:hypothetical protein